MTYDADFIEETELVIRCLQRLSVGVRFCDPFRSDVEYVQYAVELWAPGLSARVDEVVGLLWTDDLARFFEDLAADYRGWVGERVWQSHDRDLTVSAVFRSGGHVGLTWTVRPWRVEGWDATVITWLEAGEQMTALGADIRHFLAQGADVPSKHHPD